MMFNCGYVVLKIKFDVVKNNITWEPIMNHPGP